jgi:hypothetical protein
MGVSPDNSSEIPFFQLSFSQLLEQSTAHSEVFSSQTILFIAEIVTKGLSKLPMAVPRNHPLNQ